MRVTAVARRCLCERVTVHRKVVHVTEFSAENRGQILDVMMRQDVADLDAECAKG